MKKGFTRKELINGLVLNARSLKRLHDESPEAFSMNYCIRKLCAMACFLHISGVLSYSDKLLFQDIIDRFF